MNKNTKGKIINFEWMCDENYYSFEQYDPFKLTKMKGDINAALDKGYNLIVGLYLTDGFCHLLQRPEVFLEEIYVLKKLVDDASAKLILVSGQGENFPDLPVDYVFFDYTLRMVAESFKYLSKEKTFSTYNLESNKFLFLGGAPDRNNRTLLMSKFHDKNLLKKSEWSYFPPQSDKMKEWCRQCLIRYSDSEYEQFMMNCQRSFDDEYEKVLPYYSGMFSWYDVVQTYFIKNASYIDHNVFNNTAFSIISEGPNFWSDDNFFLTEKTWRTLLLNHPFIFAGHPDQFRYLKKLGFKTFEEYMLIKDYAYIEDEHKRLDAIVINTENFLKDIKHFNHEIEKDVKFNHELTLDYINKQDQFLKKLNTDYKIDKEEISFYFNRTGYEQLIVRHTDGEL